MSTQEIDSAKEKKFEEFIRVYLFNGASAPKSDPNSTRSVLAKNRSLKLKKKLYECEMHSLPKIKRLDFSAWEKQRGHESYVQKVNEIQT